MKQTKRKSIVGITYFEMIDKHNLNETEFIVYSFMLARLQYVNKLTFEGKHIEGFNISEDGFGRFSLTYIEAEELLHINDYMFKKAIRGLEDKKLLYIDLIPNSKGNAKINMYYPVIPDGILAWEHWAFRVYKEYGEFIEKSINANNLTLADILNQENFDETEETVVHSRPFHI